MIVVFPVRKMHTPYMGAGLGFLVSFSGELFQFQNKPGLLLFVQARDARRGL